MLNFEPVKRASWEQQMFYYQDNHPLLVAILYPHGGHPAVEFPRIGYVSENLAHSLMSGLPAVEELIVRENLARAPRACLEGQVRSLIRRYETSLNFRRADEHSIEFIADWLRLHRDPNNTLLLLLGLAQVSDLLPLRPIQNVFNLAFQERVLSAGGHFDAAQTLEKLLTSYRY
jgi:hypothetical protein